MTLDECYRTLCLQSPLDYEQEVYDTSIWRKELRRKKVGSTTHMMVEAALDWKGFRSRALNYTLKICYDVIDENLLSPELFFNKLFSPAEAQEFSECFIPCKQGSFSLSKFIKSVDEHSIVYVDHFLLNPKMRVVGPNRLIRTIVQNENGTFNGLDRDDQLVSILTNNSLKSLLDLSTCPVNVVSSNGHGHIAVGGLVTHDCCP